MLEWFWTLKVNHVAGPEAALEVYSVATGWIPQVIDDTSYGDSFIATSIAATYTDWRILTPPTKVWRTGTYIKVPQSGAILGP